jgi:hypothetical protein
MGNVNTHAMRMWRTVLDWRPDRFAAMVPATPDDKT